MRGGQWQVLYLMTGLREAGHACVLLTPEESPLFRIAVAMEFDVAPLGPGALYHCSRTADLTHAHDARSHTLAALLARRPFVVARRVGFPVNKSVLSKWKYRRAERYLAVSRFAGSQLERAGVPARKVTLVPDGVPLPETTASRDAGFVLAPAFDDPRKGSAAIREAARMAGVEVRFSRNLEADLPRTCLFVYISEAEGLGSAALLAMAWGIPVVASRIPGLDEAVVDGRTGLLVNNQPGEIAAAMRRLLDDPQLGTQMGTCGRMRVEREFSTDLMVQRSLQVYRQVLAC
jgi:glycosyltransferase involved in cell wall biosynthesis